MRYISLRGRFVDYVELDAASNRGVEEISQLLDQAWEYDFEHRSNVIEVYIRYLRRKIDLPFGVKSLETVRGAGYVLKAE
jgi:DNA-binding response OmpR family regulator